MSVSGIWVVRDYRKGKRVPQDQSRVQLVACRLARAHPPAPIFSFDWGKGGGGRRTHLLLA